MNAVYLLYSGGRSSESADPGALEFGMIILVFLLMTFSPVVIDAITGWLKNIFQKYLDSENPGKAVSFLERLQR